MLFNSYGYNSLVRVNGCELAKAIVRDRETDHLSRSGATCFPIARTVAFVISICGLLDVVSLAVGDNFALRNLCPDTALCSSSEVLAHKLIFNIPFSYFGLAMWLLLALLSLGVPMLSYPLLEASIAVTFSLLSCIILASGARIGYVCPRCLLSAFLVGTYAIAATRFGPPHGIRPTLKLGLAVLGMTTIVPFGWQLVTEERLTSDESCNAAKRLDPEIQKILSRNTRPNLGAANGPKAIILFGDFDCPATRGLLKQILPYLPQQSLYRVMWVQFPLNGHQYSFEAAAISEAAQDHGTFAKFVGLTASARSLSVPLLHDMCRQCSIDLSRVRLEAETPTSELRKRLLEDIGFAKEAGLHGVPEVFLLSSSLQARALATAELLAMLKRASKKS